MSEDTSRNAMVAALLDEAMATRRSMRRARTPSALEVSQLQHSPRRGEVRATVNGFVTNLTIKLTLSDQRPLTALFGCTPARQAL